MQYLGAKTRIAKQIAAHLESIAPAEALVEDRFCGGLSVAVALRHRPLACSDGNAALVCTLRAVQDGWVPPEYLSEEDYYRLRELDDPADPLTAFAAAGCAYGGKWWSGYARGKQHPRGFAGYASRSLCRKLQALAGVPILHRDYRDDPPAPGTVVYCDPPYVNTYGYPACGKFDHVEFWRTVSGWARDGVIVRVSECVAPEEWEPVITFGQVQRLSRSRGGKKPTCDVLWKLKGAA
jgi:DNA adenine methylase